MAEHPNTSWAATPTPEVPIAAIEHFSYCPRQCALIHIEQTFDDNIHTMRGHIAHECVDSGLIETRPGIKTMRSVPLWSEQHRLLGKADVVEFPANAPPFPVEHKVGRRRKPHADLQLCAQAICLEEMLGVPVPEGAIYSYADRRRHTIQIDSKLRSRTLEIVAAIRHQFAAQQLPPAVDDARCPPCSLLHSCLPSVAAQPARLRGLQGALYSTGPSPDDPAT